MGQNAERLQKTVMGLYRISEECFVRGKIKAIILQHGNMLEIAKSVSQFKICACACVRALVLMDTPVADSQEHSNETWGGFHKALELSSLTVRL